MRHSMLVCTFNAIFLVVIKNFSQENFPVSDSQGKIEFLSNYINIGNQTKVKTNRKIYKIGYFANGAPMPPSPEDKFAKKCICHDKRGRGHWNFNFTGTQSLLPTLSYLLALGTILNFYCFSQTSNVQTFKPNILRSKRYILFIFIGLWRYISNYLPLSYQCISLE